MNGNAIALPCQCECIACDCCYPVRSFEGRLATVATSRVRFSLPLMQGRLMGDPFDFKCVISCASSSEVNSRLLRPH